MSLTRPVRAMLLALGLALLASLAVTPTAAEAQVTFPRWDGWAWADADTASIHPGVQTRVEGGQCTSNFVFVQVEAIDGVEYLTDVLLGYAGHCAAETGNADECTDIAYPVGHPVEVQGATTTASVAYNASLTMRRIGETDTATCMNNDFGLVRIARADWTNVNPSVPVFGGPVALARGGTAVAEPVYSWGNSSLRFGIEQTSPKRGLSLGTDNEGWNHNVFTVTPGIPGDSGSGYLDADGNALAVVSTVEAAPFPASNNVTDLALSMDYVIANEPGLANLRLVPGTEPFDDGAILR
ncbi:hypothetical protein [Euzebya rosea]|uniref:hypothetical protein n=1 Tax=Euzebya rosea TaxID=2052804 RepID=UPI00196AF0BB|nr:hypothetical protein [Euzebya rosea]